MKQHIYTSSASDFNPFSPVKSLYICNVQATAEQTNKVSYHTRNKDKISVV